MEMDLIAWRVVSGRHPPMAVNRAVDFEVIGEGMVFRFVGDGFIGGIRQSGHRLRGGPQCGD
jgi:hypothetical protein